MLIHRPAIYEHAAALIRRLPMDVVADPAALYHAHATACRRYGLAHVVVATDIYGADSAAVADAIGREPQRLAELADVPAADFPAGPQRSILAAATRLRGELARDVDVRLPVTGPFSLATALLGFEPVMLAMVDEPDAVSRALDALADAQARLVRAAAATGCGVTLFESAASPPLLSPRDFERVVLPRLAMLVGQARAATGRPPELILGGATGPILPTLLSLAPALVICDPANDTRRFLAGCREAEVDLRVNLPANLLLPAHRVQAHHELEQLARLARGGGPLYLATGVTPFDAVPDHLLAFTDLVRQVNDAV